MKSREQSLFAGLLQKQSRTQLAIILGVVAMLLILFSELFSTPAKTAASAGSSAAVSETAYREQLETQLKELIEVGKKRSMLWIRSPARCRTRRPMFCWRMAPPWKRRPICLPSAVWLLSVMVGEMSGSPPASQSLSGHCWIFRPIEFV